jgi:hypothetical protein
MDVGETTALRPGATNAGRADAPQKRGAGIVILVNVYRHRTNS